MLWYDFITGFFEIGAALIVALNIPVILRDKMVRGVSVFPTLFFILWSLWNLWLFPHLGMWVAFAATFGVIAANGTWVALVFYYRAKEKK